jgi:drug/metabolite transporter (DMT)-like permease
LNKRTLSYTACIMAYVLWGSTGIFVRVIGAGAMTLVFMDSIIGLTCLLPLVIIRRSYKELLNRRAIITVISIGLLGTITPTLFNLAVQTTTVTNTILSHYMMPFFVVLLAPLLIGEMRQRSVVFALPVGMLGLAAIMPLENITFQSRDLLGILIALASAVTFALQLLITRKFCVNLSAYTTAAAMCAMSIITLGPFVLSQPDQLAMIGSMPLWFIVKGILNNAIPGLIYVWSLKAIEAQRISVIGFLEPLSAIILAFIFLGEVPGFRTLIGGALILGAGYWVITRRPEQPVEPAQAFPGLPRI